MGETTYFLVAIGLAVLFAVYLTVSKPKPLEPERKFARVAFVIDGDTLKLEGIKPRIRLWGVDAPEKGQGGSLAATKALQSLSKGKRVSYIKVDTDRYGRIVARVFLPDGREINRLLIEQSAAREYCSYSKGFYGRCQNKI